MNTFTKWRVACALAFGLYAGFLAGGIVGAAGELHRMITLMLLAALTILLVVLWFKSTMAEERPGLWDEAIDAAEHELREYRHYMNDPDNERQLAAAAVRAALDTLRIVIDT